MNCFQNKTLTRISTLALMGALTLGCPDDGDDVGGSGTDDTATGTGTDSTSSTTGQGESDDTTVGTMDGDSTTGTDDTTTGEGTDTTTDEGDSESGSGSGGVATELRLGLTRLGDLDLDGAEIAAFDAENDFLYVTASTGIQRIDLSDPTAPMFDTLLDPAGSEDREPTSVAVHSSIVAVALPAEAEATEPGEVVFYDAEGNEIGREGLAGASSLPDMVTFSPDGSIVLVANEAEPEGYYPGDGVDIEPQVDRPGAISVIDVTLDPANFAAEVHNFGFASFQTAYDNGDLDDSIRGIMDDAAFAASIEPEYIAVSPDGTQAWVTLQENNAFAALDLTLDYANNVNPITAIVGMGFRDHSQEGNGLDGQEEGVANISTYPIFGIPMADSVVSFQIGDATYYVAANEGDAREYDGVLTQGPTEETEEIGIGQILADTDDDETAIDETTLVLDPESFDADAIAALGEITDLNVTFFDGRGEDGEFETLYSFGSRSISIYDSAGTLVWDSGDAIEQITLELFPDYFNSNDDEVELDARSGNKGPEPEGLDVGEVFDGTYVFVGLERMGGIMVWDITDPAAPVFQTYQNDRDYEGVGDVPDDLAPEGILFIAPEDSPNGEPLLVVTNEVSSNIAVYQIEQVPVEE